jgi:hypothetical protein
LTRPERDEQPLGVGEQHGTVAHLTAAAEGSLALGHLVLVKLLGPADQRVSVDSMSRTVSRGGRAPATPLRNPRSAASIRPQSSGSGSGSSATGDVADQRDVSVIRNLITGPPGSQEPPMEDMMCPSSTSRLTPLMPLAAALLRKITTLAICPGTSGRVPTAWR